MGGALHFSLWNMQSVFVSASFSAELYLHLSFLPNSFCRVCLFIYLVIVKMPPFTSCLHCVGHAMHTEVARCIFWSGWINNQSTQDILLKMIHGRINIWSDTEPALIYSNWTMRFPPLAFSSYLCALQVPVVCICVKRSRENLVDLLPDNAFSICLLHQRQIKCFGFF